MTKKHRLIEGLKTALIVVLLVLTVFLLWHTDYYDNAFNYIFGVFATTRESIQASAGEESVQHSPAHIDPMAVSVYLGAGSRYASIYEKETVQSDYQRFSAYLAEALGSSGEPVKVSRQLWLNALAKEGVYFRFHTPQPLSLLSDILGAKMTSSAGFALSEELCLVGEEGSVRLYYVSGSDYYCCDTAVSNDALIARLYEFIPNGSYFSHEISSLEKYNSNMLVPENLPAIYRVSSGSVPAAETLRQLLFDCFEINEYTFSEYMENNNVHVYLDNTASVHIIPGGSAEYFGSGSIKADSTDTDSMMNICWDIINDSVYTQSNMADIYFSHMENSGDICRIYFSYSINNIPINLSGGSYAGVFEFDKTELVYAKLCFRNFSLGEDTLEVLPIRQAAAVAFAGGISKIKLVYSESDTEINCVWVSK